MLAEDLGKLADKVVGVVAGAVILILIGLSVAGGRTVAVTTDEPAHVDMYNTYLESGWYTTEVPSEADDVIADEKSYVLVYGPLVHEISHVIAVSLGIEESKRASLNTGSQEVRRGVLAAMLVLGVIAMIWAGRIGTGRWSWGLLGGAFLVAIPVLSGSAMFNVKDLPAAMGLTLLITGLMTAFKGTRQRSWGTQAVASLAIAAGWTFTLGSRPALALIVIGVVGIAILAGVVILARTRGSATTASPRTALASLFVGSALGYVLLLILYPKLFEQPIRIIFGSLNSASEFGWGGFTLMAGDRVSSQPGWSYIPLWVFAQAPLYLLAAAITGITVMLIAWLTLVKRGELLSHVNAAYMLGATLWVAITIGIPVVLIPTDPFLYNGLRQVLFILPGLSFLALLGTWWVWCWLRESDRRVASTVLVTAAVIAGLVFPSVAQLRLFPYSYAAYNSAIVLAGIDGRWETDYWGASLNELRSTAQEARDMGDLPPYFFAPPDFCDEADYAGRWKEPDGSTTAALDGEASFFCQVRTWGRNTPPEGCSVGWAVQRPQFWQQSTMSLIAKCPFTAAESPDNGIDFAVQSQDAGLESEAEPFLLWGWQISPELGIYSNSNSVGLGIELPTELRMTDLELDLALKADLPDGVPLEVMIRANGEAIGDLRFTDESKEQTARIDIPAQVVDRRENDLMVIRIDRIGSDEASRSSMFLFPEQLKLSAN